MTLKFLKILSLTAVIAMTCGIFSHANAKTLGIPKGLNKKTVAPLCTPSTSVGTLNLQSVDRERLKLARAFRGHLENKGQDSEVINAIYKASLKSGVDFELMLLKGIMESDLGRYTVATGSTARGLFQYIEPTWLVLMKRYGAQIGYAHYADAISYTRRTGIPYIKNENKYLKAEILALRYDDEASAMIKTFQIKEETDALRQYKGSSVNATDHYISHMLGLPLTRELYDLRKRGSIIAVARLNKPQMREAAKLNKPFFYKGKKPLAARDVYKKFEARVNREFKNIRKIASTGAPVICTAAKN